MKEKIIFFAVPNSLSNGSGPAVRVTKFSKEFQRKGYTHTILGSSLSKFKQALKAPAAEILYVESATNRLKLLDLLSLLILRLKAGKCIVFIRDVYIEMFPDEYRSLRSRITKLFNRISNFIYCLLADKMAFPTVGMGEYFFEQNTYYRKRPILALPPGTDLIESLNAKAAHINAKPPEVKILYLGGIKYRYSGIRNFLKMAKKLHHKYKFYVVSYDKLLILKMMQEMGLQKDQIVLQSLNYEGVKALIKKENITFAFHARPLNDYDRITYPIKIMDYLSFGLPFLSEAHLPIVKLMGEDYPLFVNIEDHYAVEQLIDQYSKGTGYQSVLNQLEQAKNQNTYAERLEKLITIF